MVHDRVLLDWLEPGEFLVDGFEAFFHEFFDIWMGRQLRVGRTFDASLLCPVVEQFEVRTEKRAEVVAAFADDDALYEGLCVEFVFYPQGGRSSCRRM